MHRRCRVKHLNRYSDFLEAALGLKKGQTIATGLFSLFVIFLANLQYKKTAKKTYTKLILHYMGKKKISYVTEIKFKIWRVTF